VNRYWGDALRDAVNRVCEGNGSDGFTRQQLIERELPRLVHETCMGWIPPEKMMDLQLRKLRDLGEIEFLEPGTYRRKTTLCPTQRFKVAPLRPSKQAQEGF